MLHLSKSRIVLSWALLEKHARQNFLYKLSVPPMPRAAAYQVHDYPAAGIPPPHHGAGTEGQELGPLPAPAFPGHSLSAASILLFISSLRVSIHGKVCGGGIAFKNCCWIWIYRVLNFHLWRNIWAVKIDQMWLTLFRCTTIPVKHTSCLLLTWLHRPLCIKKLLFQNAFWTLRTKLEFIFKVSFNNQNPFSVQLLKMSSFFNLLLKLLHTVYLSGEKLRSMCLTEHPSITSNSILRCLFSEMQLAEVYWHTTNPNYH